MSSNYSTPQLSPSRLKAANRRRALSPPLPSPCDFFSPAPGKAQLKKIVCKTDPPLTSPPPSSRHQHSPLSTPTVLQSDSTTSVSSDRMPSTIGYSFSPFRSLYERMTKSEITEKVLEQDVIIQEMKSSIESLRAQVTAAEQSMAAGHRSEGRNAASELIKTSNRLSMQENRVHKRDMKLLEEELDAAYRQTKQLKAEFAHEADRARTLESSLSRLKSSQAEAELTLSAAVQKLELVEKRLAEKEQLLQDAHQDSYNSKIILKAKTAELEERVSRYRTASSAEKERNERLLAEVELLKTALEESREEFNRQMAINRDHLAHALNDKPASRVSEGHTSLNKYLAEKLLWSETRIKELENEAIKLKEQLDDLRQALSEQKIHQAEFEGDQEKTHKYMQEEISRITMQKANLRCDYLKLEREFKQLQFEKNLSEAGREHVTQLEKERDVALKQTADIKKKLEDVEKELHLAKESLDRSAGDAMMISTLRKELHTLQLERRKLADSLITLNEQCEQYIKLKNAAEEGRKRAKNETAVYQLKVVELEKELEGQMQLERHQKDIEQDRDKLKDKCNYLQDKLEEAHSTYRELLVLQAKKLTSQQGQGQLPQGQNRREPSAIRQGQERHGLYTEVGPEHQHEQRLAVRREPSLTRQQTGQTAQVKREPTVGGRHQFYGQSSQQQRSATVSRVPVAPPPPPTNLRFPRQPLTDRNAPAPPSSTTTGIRPPSSLNKYSQQGIRQMQKN